jgi:hypothetical protein
MKRKTTKVPPRCHRKARIKSGKGSYTSSQEGHEGPELRKSANESSLAIPTAESAQPQNLVNGQLENCNHIDKIDFIMQ